MTQKFPWTDEQVATLKARWKEGFTSSEIATELQASRNMILGKLNRLGLLGERSQEIKAKSVTRSKLRRAAAEARKASRQVKSPAIKRDRVMNNFAAVNAVRRAEPGQPVDVAPVVFDATKAKPWTERAFGECAYPISGEGADTFSCCQPAARGAYCKAHGALMFNKPPETLSRFMRLAKYAA